MTAVVAGLVAAAGTVSAAGLTAAAIELSIRHGLDFLRTVDANAGLFVAAAVVTAATQPFVLALVVGRRSATTDADAYVLGAALVAVGAALQAASAALNVVLGADLAADGVASGDPALGAAVHDIADGLYFVANSLVGLGVGVLGRWSTSPALTVLGVVAATANLTVYVAFAVEALWWIGAIGVGAVAAWYAVAAMDLRRPAA